jgi:hypothetical protein
MRAFFPPIIVSSAIFLAPCAYGNTLQPGPTGSAPTEKSFFLTFDRSGSTDSRSYIVDSKGFYERDGWSRSDYGRIGVFSGDEGSPNKGFSSNLSFNGFNSKGSSGLGGGSFLGGAGFSSGAANGSGGSLSGGSGFFSMKGLGEAAGLAGGNKGSGFILSDSSGSSGPPNLGEGSKGPGDPVVSATPLPASWTVMLIGLAFGLLVWLRKSNSSTTRKRERPAVA